MSGEIVGRVQTDAAMRAMTEAAEDEMKRARAAVRTLTRIGYTFEGGPLWKPPLGTEPKLPPDWTAATPVPSPQPVFCAKCRHFTPLIVGAPRCGRDEAALARGAVYGDVNYGALPRCSIERRRRWFPIRDRCGPEGRYFEPAAAAGDRPTPPPSSDD